MVSTAAFECGAKEQTAEYVMTSFRIYHHPNVARALSDVEKNLATWMMSGHLVELPALVHLPQTKKSQRYETTIKVTYCARFLKLIIILRLAIGQSSPLYDSTIQSEYTVVNKLYKSKCQVSC